MAPYVFRSTDTEPVMSTLITEIFSASKASIKPTGESSVCLMQNEPSSPRTIYKQTHLSRSIFVACIL